MKARDDKQCAPASSRSAASRSGAQRGVLQGKRGTSLAAHASGLASDVVQRSAEPGRAAALPAHGSGMVIPPAVQSKMEQAFGADFGGVRIHQGMQAPAMGALAYTAGTDIHFAPGQYDPHSSRGQALLGHELAHVVQQAQGRVRPTVQAKGVALNDDASLEREADLLGSRAARGEAATSGPGAVAAPAGAGVVQRFALENIVGEDWRISDDQKMAVYQESPVYGGRRFYAESGLISSSNDKLAGQKSSLALEADASDEMDAPSPDGSKTTKLVRVVPENLEDKSKGNERATGMKWVEDCGLAANTVMHGKGRMTQGVYNLPSAVANKQSWFAQVWASIAGSEQTTEKARYGTVYSTHRGRNFFSPHKMLDEILKAALEDNDADKAWDKYKKLNAGDRDTFDREVGINKYAAPDIGEAFTIVANKDENIDMKTWNFHWGAVVMKSGGDYVTMENFAGSGTDAWDFQMYGPTAKAGQSFHEQQKSRKKHDGVTPEYGDNPTTVRARPTS